MVSSHVPPSCSDLDRPSSLLYLSAFLAALGPLLAGLASGFVGPSLLTMTGMEGISLPPRGGEPRGYLEAPPHLHIFSKYEGAWFSSILALGAIFGCLASGFLNDFFGRRGSLILGGAGVMLCVSLVGLLENAQVLMGVRIAWGFFIALCSTSCPLYLSEISTRKLRGVFGNLTHIGICTGMFVAYFLGGFCCREHNVEKFLSIKNEILNFSGDDNSPVLADLLKNFEVYREAQFCDWRLLAFLINIPAGILVLSMLFICPESPRWLAMKKKVKEAEKSLKMLRNFDKKNGKIEENQEKFNEEVLEEVRKMEKKSGESQSSFFEICRSLISQKLRYQFFLAILLLSFRLLGGSHTIVLYMRKILKAAGLSRVRVWTLLVMLFSVCCTLVSVWQVEKAGRKKVFISAALLGSVSMGALSLAFTFPSLHLLAVIGCFGFMGSFSLGMGPIPHILTTEILPDKERAVGYSFGGAAQWGVSFLTTASLEGLLEKVGYSGLFGIYAGICVFMAFSVFFLVPETKGKNFEEIQKGFENFGFWRKEGRKEEVDLERCSTYSEKRDENSEKNAELFEKNKISSTSTRV